MLGCWSVATATAISGDHQRRRLVPPPSVSLSKLHDTTSSSARNRRRFIPCKWRRRRRKIVCTVRVSWPLRCIRTLQSRNRVTNRRPKTLTPL
ncbi:putative Hedgehog receptor patched [Daphnia magna]|uniref:Putative Hedgehog receptor patched n=1 Tax=Daphnia magna TaxID=35525 RepID=A0A0P6C2P5_9CRUS|nr:putative Hedgehog receptor patched [Daphnia magna]